MKNLYLTTTIPFVNASPHIGFALELVQADALARYHRQCGRRVRFQTGTDENALKNVLAARAHGLTTRELVDRNAALFRGLAATLQISADEFIRTTEPRHRHAVHRLWERLKPDDVYRKSYLGHYCVGCEDFLLERDLVDGKCPDHAAPPAPVEEENYFFRLSAYQQPLEELLATDRIRVVPEKRKNEVLAFVRRGLQDISISRAATRAGGWGIPVPGDESQVIYVWIDALINYLSGLGFSEGDAWQDWWNTETEKTHLIGKNVWKFHAVYWPALLLSAGLPLPDVIPVHGFLTENGRKISKSLGNTVDPFACAAQVGADGLRYYLLRAIPPFDDGDFSAERLRRLYHDDLANGLGNLVSRLTALCVKADYGQFTPETDPAAPDGFHDAVRAYAFDAALALLWERIDGVNRDIVQVEPWHLVKSGDSAVLHGHLTGWLRTLHSIACWLAPFLPTTAATITQAVSASPIVPAKALFPRLS